MTLSRSGGAGRHRSRPRQRGRGFRIGIGVWATTRPAGGNAFADVVDKPGARVITMAVRGALAVAPDGSAAVALTLPRAPSGKTYEAWVIRKDGSQARRSLRRR